MRIDSINKNDSEKMEIPVAIWTIKDILIVFPGVLFISIVFYISLLYLFGDTVGTFRLARYVSSILMIFLPVMWVKKRYGLSKEVLGLRRGRYSKNINVVIGILTGVLYTVLIQITPLQYTPVSNRLKVTEHIYDLITAPISISGFATIVLAPIGEEIMDRGFMYGYLRRKVGVTIGLLLQAMIFSLLHLKYIYGNSIELIINAFIIGLILGILYEKTKSIYPSIICHGVINYLAIVLTVMQWG
jgi:hypothetical protein